MANVGLSFGDPGARGGQLRSSPAATTQDAIRTLSIRMPTVLGASAPAPPSLLGGPTMQGGMMGGGSPQEQFLRMLFGGQPMASSPMMMGNPGLPQGAGPPPSGALPASVEINDEERRRREAENTPPMPPTGQGMAPQVPRFGDPFNGGREGRNRV